MFLLHTDDEMQDSLHLRKVVDLQRGSTAGSRRLGRARDINLVVLRLFEMLLRSVSQSLSQSLSSVMTLGDDVMRVTLL